MATIQEVNTSIMFGDFNNDQLNSIIAAVKYRRNQLTRQNVGSLTIGDKVRFLNTSNKYMTQYIEGNVTKINRKYVIVKEDDTIKGAFVYHPRSWRVPAVLLERI